MRNIKEEVLKDVECFLKEHPNFTRSSFGIQVANNKKLLLWLSRGRGSIYTLDKIYKFMAEYK